MLMTCKFSIKTKCLKFKQEAVIWLTPGEVDILKEMNASHLACTCKTSSEYHSAHWLSAFQTMCEDLYDSIGVGAAYVTTNVAKADTIIDEYYVFRCIVIGLLEL